MHKNPFRKIGALMGAILLVTAGAAYALWPRQPQYTQVLIGASPSESASSSAIVDCARRAVDGALAHGGSTIDIAVVSGAPAEMRWTTIEGRQSLWTRLSIGNARKERKKDAAEAMDAADALLNGKRPTGSSDQLAALASAASRASSVAGGIPPARRRTVLCGDGHWVGSGRSSYRSALDRRGITEILDSLRGQNLLPDWRGAGFTIDQDTVDRLTDLPASREAAIRRFWVVWAAASHADLR